MIDESHIDNVENNFQMASYQKKMLLLEGYHDAAYIKYCSESEIEVQKHLANSNAIRKLFLELEEQQSQLKRCSISLNNEIQQLRNQLSQIEIQKLKPCEKYFVSIWEYSNRNSFQKIVEQFIKKFSENSKDAIEELTYFTSNYLSKNIHKEVQKTINQLVRDLKKRDVLYKPRINTIYNCLLNKQQLLSNLAFQLQKVNKKLLNLKIDQQIAENQYRIAVEKHEARLQQAENYIKVQAKILNLQYIETLKDSENNNIESTADFEALLFKEFMQRLNQYTQCIIKLEQLATDVSKEYSQIKQSALILKNINEHCNTSRTYYQESQKNIEIQTKLPTTRRLTFDIQNEKKLANIPKMYHNGTYKTFIVYKKTIIGHDPNLIQDGNFQPQHLRQFILRDNEIGFAKDYLKQKIDIRRIEKIQVKSPDHILMKLKKNFILLKLHNCTLLELLGQIQTHYPTIFIDRK